MDKLTYDLWWVPVVRGISSIAFGILLLVWPAATIGVVAVIFASLFAVFGITDIITGFQGLSKSIGSLFRLLFGILEVAIVVYLFQNSGSGLTLALMGLLMAINLIVLSIVMVGSAFLSEVSGGLRWLAGIGGLFTFFIGLTVARAPAVSIATVILVLGVFGLIMGPIEIASGLLLHSQAKKA